MNNGNATVYSYGMSLSEFYRIFFFLIFTYVSMISIFTILKYFVAINRTEFCISSVFVLFFDFALKVEWTPPYCGVPLIEMDKSK